MAIVVVLCLSIALLILGSAYISTLRNQTPVNPNLLASLQAELLAQGVTQIAMLKFKEMPSCLYYAAIASKSGNIAPYLEFRGGGGHPGQLDDGDALMNLSLTTPFRASANTNFQMLSSKMYDDMNLKITVVVDITAADGTIIQKAFEHTLNGVRRGN